MLQGRSGTFERLQFIALDMNLGESNGELQIVEAYCIDVTA